MEAAAPAQTFPWSWYVDPAVLAAEQEGVFRRCWQYVARADQVAEPASFVATRAGDVPVLVVRGNDGELRALLNVPPPRLARLRRRGPSRDAAVPVPRVDVRPRRGAALGAASRPRAGFRGGRSATAATAGRHLGPLCLRQPGRAGATASRDVLGALGPPRQRGHRRGRAAVRPRRAEAEYNANWKVCGENYHRVLPLPGRPSGVLEGRRRLSGRVPARNGRLVLEPVRRCASARPASSTPAARSNAASSTFFPNTTINVMPGRPPVHRPVIPHGPERTYRFADYFVARTRARSGSRICSRSTTRSEPRTGRSSSAFRPACGRDCSTAAACCPSRSAGRPLPAAARGRPRHDDPRRRRRMFVDGAPCAAPLARPARGLRATSQVRFPARRRSRAAGRLRPTWPRPIAGSPTRATAGRPAVRGCAPTSSLRKCGPTCLGSRSLAARRFASTSASGRPHAATDRRPQLATGVSPRRVVEVSRPRRVPCSRPTSQAATPATLSSRRESCLAPTAISGAST